MIRFAARLEDGKNIIGLGLQDYEFENLKNGQQIIFPGKEVGMDDERNVIIYYLKHYEEPSASLVRDYCLVMPISEGGINKLINGEICKGELIADELEVAIFYCEDPNDFFDEMLQAGAIKWDTRVEGVPSFKKPPNPN